MVETRRTCVLAMSRLRGETVRATPFEYAWGVMGNWLGDSMLIVYAHDERPDGCPDDLWACLRWARQQGSDGSDPPKFGYDYVIFDRDVDPLEDGCELPIFGYDDAGLGPTAGPWGQGTQLDVVIGGRMFPATPVLSGEKLVALVMSDPADPQSIPNVDLIESAWTRDRQFRALAAGLRKIVKEADDYDDSLNEIGQVPDGAAYEKARSLLHSAAGMLSAVEAEKFDG